MRWWGGWINTHQEPGGWGTVQGKEPSAGAGELGTPLVQVVIKVSRGVSAPSCVQKKPYMTWKGSHSDLKETRQDKVIYKL